MPKTTDHAIFLRWNAAIWFSIALFGATQTVFVMRAEGMHHAWTALYVTQLLAWLPWALATPLVLGLGRRFPIEKRSLSAAAAHLAACAAIDLGASAWTTLLEELLNPWAVPAPAPFVPLWFDHVENGILQSLFLYGAVLAAGYIVVSRERLARQQIDAARLSEALACARLDALQRQIEPHFLFNALNSAVALVRDGRNDAAAGTLVALSEVLRRLIHASGTQEVTLGDEIDFLDRYLQIQKMRFADRLRIEIEVADELKPARVPCLVLQPLVENAIKHGIAARAGAGHVRVAAASAGGRLELTVYNDGPALAAGTSVSGVGLANVRARLRGLYGDAFALDLRDAPGGVQASVSLPCRLGAT